MEQQQPGEMINLHEGEKGLYDEAMDYLKTKMLFADELCPTFLASVGCFIANEYQLSSGKSIYSYKGLPEDLCLHVAIISPAGFSKGHTFKIFLNKTWGIVPFLSKASGKVTEAGFVGTIRETGIIPGDAMKYAHGIVAFNEISNLFITSQSQHSGELVNQVLEALSERHVNKKLASGEIDYDTFLTIWGGTQPGRFDFSGGMERRFAYSTKAWTRKDLEDLKQDRKKNRDSKPDPEKVKILRNRFSMLKSMFTVDAIKFEDKMMEFLFDNSDSHLRMQIMEKALIGKNVLDWKGENELKIVMNDSNRDFILLLKSMHEKVAMGSDISLMINVIGEGGMSRGELWNMFRRFGYTFEKFEELLELCLKLSVIGVKIDRRNEGIEKRFFVKNLEGKE